MKKKLLIATHNQDKGREIREGLVSLKNVEFVTLAQLGITDEPEETGTTFCENAQLKAQFYSARTHLPTIADDGGLMIDALHGEPGIHAKRWMGRPASDQELITYALECMKDIPEGKRTARFGTCLWYIEPKSGKEAHAFAEIEGRIAAEAWHMDTHGFPYRAVFIITRFNKYYDQLTPEEHAQINHRLYALGKLKQSIRNMLY